MTTLEKIPLNSREAEDAVLGSILIDPDILIELELVADDFYTIRNRMIWCAIQELRASGQSIDYLTISGKLEAKQQLDDIGGRAYLMGLYNSTPTSLHAKSYSEILIDKTRRRNLLRLANQMANTAYDEDSNLEATTPGFIQSLIDTSRVKDGARPISEFASELYDEVEARADNPTDMWGIASGFPTLDRVTGGFQQGELMILSGVPGVGKSMLAMQFAAQMGVVAPGAIYSIEMSGKSVVRRLASGMAQIPTRNLKTGRMQGNEWNTFTSAIEKLAALPVFMSDGSNWTTTSLRADLARLKAQYKIQWFVLDYLYLLNDGAGSDEIERTALASKGLKRTTKELGLAGIAVHSMNKSGMAAENGVPGQEQLRGSGQVVYDADLITFLTKYNANLDDRPIPAADQENVRVLWFGKGRELEDPRKFVRLVKRTGLPAFAEYSDGGMPR